MRIYRDIHFISQTCSKSKKHESSHRTQRALKNVRIGASGISCRVMRIVMLILRIMTFWDFPGTPVFENPSVNAKDTGMIPALERFHMPSGN